MEPSASLAAAKEAYRRYVKEFHPDKFPAGSDAQKLAAEKMIAANAHFEKLKNFFQEFPNGKPGGSGSTRQEPHNDSDWEAWEKQRHNAFEDELKEWQQRQAAIEQVKSATRETLRRRKMLLYVRVGLVLATLAMWKGWASVGGSGGNVFVLLILSVGVGWLLMSSKGKAIADEYLAGANK